MKKLVIDKASVKNNLRAAIKRAEGSQVIADLGADAFGLGLLETAKLLREEGVRMFAVSEVRDASRLRDAGFTEETIYMLRSTADRAELEQLIALNVVCTVGSSDAGVAINGIAESRGTIAEVQLKVDVGMGRYGFPCSEVDKMAAVYQYMNSLAVVGVFTTLSDEGLNKALAEDQLESFEDVISELNRRGFETGLVHAVSGAALFRHGGLTRFDAVRVGQALTGRLDGGTYGLTPVGYIEAGIEELCWYPAGHRIGRKALKRAARLAIISVGSYHGFTVVTRAREERFSDALKTLVKAIGRRPQYVKLGSGKVKVAGCVGVMNTALDVTEQNCSVGDIAVFDVNPINVKGLDREYR